MMFNVRCVPIRNEGNPGLREDSMELCAIGGLLGVHPKVSQCPTSVKNGKTYEYISIDNIQFV